MTRVGTAARVFLVLAVFVVSAPLRAQENGDVVAADALTCWWRTDVAAVRVGEPFSLVLTCAVLDTNDVRVVPEESRLDPKAMQLPPFDVIDGARGPDFTDGPRRLFQYRYRLRLITDDKFGKDVTIPPLAISYRVRSRSTEGALSEGRDQSYALPAMAMRILSTVPEGATDIRDGGTVLFETIDRRMFRGAIVRVVGAVCLGASALALLMALAAAFQRQRGGAPARERQIPLWLVHRGIAAELAGIQRERSIGGWRPELVDRALAATRIVASLVLDMPATVFPLKTPGAAPKGTVAIPGRVLPGTWVAAASSVTAHTVADVRDHAVAAAADPVRAQSLGELVRALTALTAARYGRDRAVDEGALDDALAVAGSHVRGAWSDVIASLRSRRWTSVPLSVDTRLGSE